MIIHIIASHLRRDAEPSWRQLRFDLSGAYLHDVNLSDCHFEGSLTLSEACFSRQEATFTGSYFTNATFVGAQFQSGTTAEFAHTIWDTTALFECTKFGGNLCFDYTKFNAGSSFTGSSLGTPSGGASAASFEETTFVGTAGFTYMNVYCSLVVFTKATFIGPALFTSMNADYPQQLASVSFHSATFRGPANFEYCRLGGQANFRKSVFLCEPDTLTFLDDADFDSEDAVRFDHAEFWVTEFGEARFERAVSFYRADYATDAIFRGAVFAAPTRFEAATFKHGATFVCAEFSCGATFYRVNFGDQPIDFRDPAAWNDVRVDWDGSSPFVTSIRTQPPNVLPADWPPQAVPRPS